MEKHSTPSLEYGHEPPTTWAEVKRTLLKLSLGALIVASLIGALLLSMQPTVREHVSAGEVKIRIGLPKDASDISYRIGGEFDPNPLMFECLASEAAFREWTATKGWTLKKGRSEIIRYNDSRFASQNCLFFHKTVNGDQTTSTIYDLDSHRAYYSQSSR